MKHLRIYERFDQDDFWTRLTTQEYGDIFEFDDDDVPNPFVDISNKDSVRIDEYLIQRGWKSYHRYSWELFYQKMSPRNNVIKIMEIPDQYFILSIFDSQNYNYFKCDQIEGLIECLDHNLK